MIKNISTLLFHDLATAFRNKTFYLILFIPLFVFLTLTLLEETDTPDQKLTIGLIQEQSYPSVLLQSLRSADHRFMIEWLSDVEDGRKQLTEKTVDGILVPFEMEPKRLSLVVLKKESFHTLAIVETFSALQIAVEGRNQHWIAEISALQESGIQKQTLPIWVLMLVLLVGFIALPAQVAEEKENKSLLGLMQTPMRESEWLLAKLLSGMILAFAAVLFLHLLGRFGFGTGSGYIAFLVAGSFCFSALGIFLGFLCRRQASARTLGVLFYLPHLLPAALSDFSQKLNYVAPLLPSYPLYGPIEGILLDGATFSTFYLEWIWLIGVGLLSCLASYQLMKKRYLM